MVGDIVENFTLKDQDGNDFNLYKNLDKNILLVFYPKDNTPVCNAQLSDYNLNQETFEQHNIRIIGINAAEVSEHKSYCDHKGFSFSILSDSDKAVSTHYDALNLFEQNKRKLVLIGTDKKIIYEKSGFSFLYLNSVQIIKSLKSLKII